MRQFGFSSLFSDLLDIMTHVKGKAPRQGLHTGHTVSWC